MSPESRIENLNVFAEEQIITPVELKAQYPLTEQAIETVMRGQQTVRHILDRSDQRKFLVVGPCSIHDPQAALEYAHKLKALADRVGDKLFIAMRCYFEKPRTSTGWQGLINDPYLDNSCKIEDGLTIARKLLLDIANLGLPAAGEALDLVTPQYVQDLFSWTAIGARTTESQTHRKMASGFSCAVGFKNATNGDIRVAINAIKSAAHANHFVSIDPEGHCAVVRTKGNPNTHIVLRGGGGKPNYDAGHIGQCEEALKKAKLPVRIMVDASHENSGKQPDKQLEVIDDIARQIQGGNTSVIGLMIESNLEAGSQDFSDSPAELAYGVSITDACLSFEQTKKAVQSLYNAL